jgi:hypothetical protein
MWGQNWGTMIWGGGLVPAVGFWGTLISGAALGILGLRVLRGTKPRTLGGAALLLAVLIPLSARAVTLITFTNGTAADANQVNANFAALNPVSGYSQVGNSGTVGAQSNIFGTSFVAPRALTCTVHLQIQATPATFPFTGSMVAWAAKNENGVVTLASAGPNTGNFGMALFPVPESQEVQTAFSSQFTVASGATVQFGATVKGFNALTTATSLSAAVVYTCQ